MSSNTNKTNPSVQKDSVVLHGYLKKLKTMKKKYFVLYEECGKSPARLDYFDSEKKFKSKANPKRSITLSSCININRRLDTKFDYVITLSTKDDGFGIVMDSEDEMNNWLRSMLKLQSGPNIFAEAPRPYYEHVWQVLVQRKGLAEKKGILGSYHVCLSSKSVTLIRIGSERTNIGEQRVPVIEFFLTSIRRCGDSKCYFYMEVGRHSVIGAGELWMETKDALIAQNMHTMILNVMSTRADDSYGPMRKRSSSATETSKPVSILQRRQTHSGGKTITSSPISTLNRDRCDSLPSSRNRTTTESSGYNKCDNNSSMPPSRTMSSLNTVPSLNYNNRRSHSPPLNNNALSPTAGCSESDGSTLSIDETDSIKHCLPMDESPCFATRFYNSHSPGGVIPEENSDDWYAENKKSYLNKSHDTDTADGPMNLSRNPLGDAESEYLDMGNAMSEYMDMSNSSVSQYTEKANSASPFDTVCCDTNLAGAECSSISYGNSRTSSFTEETVDGYVNMSPQNSDYVDMEQTMKNRRTLFNANQQVSGSSNVSSVGGGSVPLKDMSFAEYSLEKINPRMLPDEDEMHPLSERPPRAYSVGSRAEHHNQKLRIEVLANAEQNNCRVRAFSVGSRSKVPRCDLQRNILMSNAANSKRLNVGASKTSIASLEPTSESTTRGRKSSSAPLLIHKSQNSVDRMDDLMEIDFSKNASSNSNSRSLQSTGGASSSSSSSSYLINPPKTSHYRSGGGGGGGGGIFSSSPNQTSSSIINNKPHDTRSDPIQIRRDNGYLEMRPVIYSHSSSGSYDEHKFSVPNQSASPEVVSAGSLAHRMKLEDAARKIETPEGYLEMSWNGNKDSSSSSASNSFKSRSPSSSLFDRKSKNLSKMPSLANNRSGSTSSKLSVLQEQSKSTTTAQCSSSSQKTTLNKLETSHRKRLTEHMNNSFTISEEKTISTDLCEKFKNLLIQISAENPSPYANNVNVDLSAADYECYSYLNFTAGIINKQRIKDEKIAGVQQRTMVVDNSSKDDYCQLKACPNQNYQKSSSSFNKSTDSDDSNNSSLKKNDSGIFVPTKAAADNSNLSSENDRTSSSSLSSPFSPSLRNHRLNNSNRQTNNKGGSGYELLHICSDSSLQTKKNITRPSSVNSDRISYPIEGSGGGGIGTQYRPNSVNNDCLQSNSVSSSTAVLCFSPNWSHNNTDTTDNRSQEHLLRTAESLNNNEDPHIHKHKNSDSISPKGLKQQHDNTSGLNSPSSKIVGMYQQPPPTSAELGLHYASLDLPIPSNKTCNKNFNTARTTSTNAAAVAVEDNAMRLSPNPNLNSNTSTQQSAFTYAKIDFNHCDIKKLKSVTQNNL